MHEATPSTKATAGTINAFLIETPPKFSRTLIAWVKTLNISEERALRVVAVQGAGTQPGEKPHPGIAEAEVS